MKFYGVNLITRETAYELVLAASEQEAKDIAKDRYINHKKHWEVTNVKEKTNYYY